MRNPEAAAAEAQARPRHAVGEAPVQGWGEVRVKKKSPGRAPAGCTLAVV